MKELSGKRVLIVGGGFGGIAAALALGKERLSGLKIVLVSEKPHFEYTPALYRAVTGKSPLEVCVPLREIFFGSGVEIIQDSVAEIDLPNKLARGSNGARYDYDFIILAVGSETAYFDIPGLREFSFGFKSITEALRLKRQIHKLFSELRKTNVVIIGGGASGVELAGELALYVRSLSRVHPLDPAFSTIALVEAAPRILPSLREDVAKRVEKRLRGLGVKIFLNRAVLGEEIKEVRLQGMDMKADIVIWTAGVKPNHLFSKILGLELDNRGRVVVDEYLQAKNWEGVFVIGDGAATLYGGMAQTAIADGKFAAQFIARKIRGHELKPYHSQPPAHAIPVGPGWAVVIVNQLVIYGRIGWWLRRLADLRFFLSVLPFWKAITAFRSGKTLCETCSVCGNTASVDGSRVN